MDILTALEAAHSPLTLDEIKEYCGLMFSKDRLDSLLRSGDVKQVPGLDDVYWCVPPFLRKRNSYKKCASPMRNADRSSLIRDITNFREKLDTVSHECDLLLLKKDTFPTQEQIDAHIQRFHDYNEIKDIGMLIIGHLAEIEKVQNKEIYEQYGLNEKDDEN